MTKGVTTYKTLLDQIAHRRAPKDKVCLATFNYDTLLEEALPTVDVKLSTMSDYLQSDYQVIKLHGSINWAREVENDVHNIQDRSQANVAHELIDRAGELQFRQSYRIIGEYPIGRSDNSPWIPLFPALAIPIETKQEYTCPTEQLDVLKKNLHQVTKMLVIGWRAADNLFLNALADGIQKDTRIMVVSSSVESATKIVDRIKGAGVSGDFVPGSDGFSRIVLSGEADDFLRS